MTKFHRVACLKPQSNNNANRVVMEWTGPDGVARSYAVNQRTLNGYTTPAELKAALDTWTTKNFSYTLADVWFHKNRNGRWVVAIGPTAPAVWPEDEGTL